MIEIIFQVWEKQDLSTKTIEHIAMFGWALSISIILGIGIGIIIFKKTRIANIVFNILNIIELIPTLALLILFLPLLGLGAPSTIAACITYSILPIARNTYFALRSLSVRFFELSCPLFIPAIASFIPSARLFRNLKIVYSPPTSIAPTPIYLT